MIGNTNEETVATYRGVDGKTYEIDHLGICAPNQAGAYAVYWQNAQITEFSDLADRTSPITTEELIELAKAAVREANDV